MPSYLASKKAASEAVKAVDFSHHAGLSVADAATSNIRQRARQVPAMSSDIFVHGLIFCTSVRVRLREALFTRLPAHTFFVFRNNAGGKVEDFAYSRAQNS